MAVSNSSTFAKMVLASLAMANVSAVKVGMLSRLSGLAGPSRSSARQGIAGSAPSISAPPAPPVSRYPDLDYTDDRVNAVWDSLLDVANTDGYAYEMFKFALQKAEEKYPYFVQQFRSGARKLSLFDVVQHELSKSEGVTYVAWNNAKKLLCKPWVLKSPSPWRTPTWFEDEFGLEEILPHGDSQSEVITSHIVHETDDTVYLRNENTKNNYFVGRSGAYSVQQLEQMASSFSTLLNIY